MPMQDTTIPIDFGQGVDTKTDPKLVVAGKMLRLENGVFTNIKRIAKRNGYTALSNAIANHGTLQAPQLAHEYKDELIVADKNLLLSYSESQDAWVSRGNYTSTQLSRVSIDQENSNSGYSDVAILGNYALYGWSTAAQVTAPSPIVQSRSLGSVVDLQTGTVLSEMAPSTSTATQTYNPVRCVLLGGTTLAIVYIKSDYSAIVIRTVVLSGGGVVTFSAETVISAAYSGTTNRPQFDIVATATGATLAYFSTTGMTITNLDASGAVTATLNTVDAARFGPIFISQNSFNSNFWVYWSDAVLAGPVPTALSTVYAVFTPALAPVLAKTVIAVQAAPYYVTNMISVSLSATQQTLYYGRYEATTAAPPPYTDATDKVTVTSAGVIGAIDFFWGFGVTPFSRPLAIGPLSYAVFIYRGANLDVSAASIFDAQQQPTYFLVKLSDVSLAASLVVARFGSGVANSQAVLTPQIGFTGNAPAINANRVLFSCGVETQQFNSDSFITVEKFPGGLVGVFSYDIDFNGPDTYRALNTGDLAVLNGGLIQAYDGQSCTEFGFHLYPEITKLAGSNVVGGNMVAGTYSYIAIYQWTDAQGNLHQSAPSLPVTVTLAGPDNAAVIDVSGSYLSQKTGVSIAIFRTQAAGGVVYYQVTDPIFPTIVDGALFVSYADIWSDASIASNPQAYTYPGSPVLENDTPAPSMVMVDHNNRLWFVDAENPWTVFYTKSVQVAVGLSPSSFMFEQIDQKFGDISALGEMDDKLVVFKPKGLCIISGDGVDDTGSGNSLSFPHFIPSDVGCTTLKSVVTMPNGIMFKSDNGIYMLDRSLGISYVGMPVEQYNSQVITSAKYVSGKSQIRFLMATGLTLVFDYIFNQWSTFTAHTGLSSTSWKNSYVYATTGGAIFKETPGFYNDNVTGFSLLAQTSWLALASVQGFQRVRRLEALGDFTNGASAVHGVQIEAAYDFSTTFQAPVSYTFGLAGAGAVFQYRERLPIQKCDSISLRITEVITGNSLEYIDLSNMSFEAGVKKGLNKLSAAQSVG